MLATAALVLSCFQLGAQSGEVQQLRFKGKSYRVYRVNLDSQQIDFEWKNSKGRPLMSLSRLIRMKQAQQEEVVFATNGGIFNPQLQPVGLYIEKGRELRQLNLKKGRGNFFMKPNGVFYINDRQEAGILNSVAYSKLDTSKNKFSNALQSGPLLLENGKIHPAFNEGSPNEAVRSGVGILDEKHLFFVLSQARVNLFDFTTLFRDKLKCKSALYLDGTISTMFVSGDQPPADHYSYGAMIVETRPMQKDQIVNSSAVQVSTEVQSPVDCEKRYTKTFRKKVIDGKKAAVAVMDFGHYEFEFANRSSDTRNEFFWYLRNRDNRCLKLSCSLGNKTEESALLVMGGKEIRMDFSRARKDEAVFLINTDGIPEMATVDEYRREFGRDKYPLYAMSTGPYLVKNNKINGDMSDEPEFYTAFGIATEKKQLVMVSTVSFQRTSMTEFLRFFDEHQCEQVVLVSQGEQSKINVNSVFSDFNQVVPKEISLVFSAYKN